LVLLFSHFPFSVLLPFPCLLALLPLPFSLFLLFSSLIRKPVNYLDGLFVAASALCQTGLSSVDFSLFSLSTQVMVMLWIIFGGLIVLSTVPIMLRLGILLLKRRGALDFQHKEIRVLVILVITIWSYILIVQLTAFLILGSYLEARHKAGTSSPTSFSLLPFPPLSLSTHFSLLSFLSFSFFFYFQEKLLLRKVTTNGSGHCFT
jgi:Trk-type K+ transport system membrane component